jgi:amidohydrolase
MEELIRFRQELHRYPELSGHERATGKRIRFFLNRYRPDILYTGIAGEGMAAIFNGNEPGPTLVFRCDLDALPIQETINRPYMSTVSGVSHACGHDGHITMVTGLAKVIIENPIKRGKVVLLYQPEEENGQGAIKSIRKLREHNVIPDYAFAIHNMPKYPMGSIITSRNSFAAASKGIVVKLFGVSSHAAFPENGVNPSLAIAEIVQGLDKLNNSKYFSDFTLITIIHLKVGEVAFGTSPGYGEMMATLRAFKDSDMKKLTENSLDLIRKIGNKHNLVVETSFDDDFPATVNDSKLTDIIERVAKENGNRVIEINEPNRWSEDFAQFTVRGPSILIGLGVGEEMPDLHSPEYDFPDEAIPYGIKIYDSIIGHFLR